MLSDTMTPVVTNATPNGATSLKEQFDRDGFVVLRDVVPPALVEQVTAAADRLYEAGVAKDGLSTRNHWEMRNCIGEDLAFQELLDLPSILPHVVDFLNWDIHLITSHLIVRAPSPAGTSRFFKGTGWHRDGGLSPVEMQEPHPRLFLKAAFFLSDQSEPGRGNTLVVPGSNRLVGKLAHDPDLPNPYGAIEVCGKPGDVFLFEQRTWHAVGPNDSDITRKTLFMGYGYRWVRAMDYQVMPEALLAAQNPLRWQLLGGVATLMGVYLPKDEDVPLRAWWNEHQQN